MPWYTRILISSSVTAALAAAELYRRKLSNDAVKKNDEIKAKEYASYKNGWCDGAMYIVENFKEEEVIAELAKRIIESVGN